MHDLYGFLVFTAITIMLSEETGKLVKMYTTTYFNFKRLNIVN